MAEYLDGSSNEKLAKLKHMVAAVHQFGVILAGHTGNFPYTDSLSLRLSESSPPWQPRPGHTTWPLSLETNTQGDYYPLISSDVIHQLPVISSKYLPDDFSQTVAVAGNDIKAWLHENHTLLGELQMAHHTAVCKNALPVQGNFLGSTIEGVTSVEQVMTVMWKIVMDNGIFGEIKSINDLLLYTVKYATGLNSFIYKFASTLPFSTLASMIQSMEAPLDLVKITNKLAVHSISMNPSSGFLPSARENAQVYWRNHVACPAVYTPNGETLKIVQGYLHNHELPDDIDVTVMDWITFSLCRQIAYRENLGEQFVEELSSEFKKRIKVLRDHGMLGIGMDRL